MRTRLLFATGAAAVLALASAACSKGVAGSQDQAVAAAVQSKLNADPALQGANIQAAALNGVVTLSGTVTSDSARTAAAADAQVPGATQVNNQIATNTPATPGNAMMAMQPRTSPAVANAAGAPPAPAMQAAAPVEVEAGTALQVRLSQALSSSTASAGQSFDGTLASPVRVNGSIAIPRGAAVTGTIAAADAAGHFKGQSRLVLQLTGLAYNGQTYNLSSQSVTKLASSRSTRSAETIGGGAAVGALIGALAGHGKGAAIGAAAGAGTGTAVEGLTKSAEVELPAETELSFALTAPLQVVPAASVH